MSKDKTPFNSPLEIGLRCLTLLNSSYPKKLDLNKLVDFDYLQIHSGDANGPPSLHPPLPLRTGEIIIKRNLIERALLLMINKQLIKRLVTDNGIQYTVSETGRPFLKSLNSNYVKALINRADWVVEKFGLMSDEDLRSLTNKFFDQWTTNFQSTEDYNK